MSNLTNTPRGGHSSRAVPHRRQNVFRAACAAAYAALSSVVSGFFFPGTARAQEPPLPLQEQQRPRQRFHIAVYGGGMSNQSSDLHLWQPSRGTDVVFEDVRWRGRPFEGSMYYGYRIGTFFKNNPRLGIELDFTHSKAYAKIEESRRVSGTWQGQPVNEVAPMNSRVQEYRITNGVNTLALDVVYRWNVGDTSAGFPEGRLQPYVAAGPAYYILFPINRVGDENNERRNYQNSGFGIGARGGLRYGLTRHISAFLEAKYTNGIAKVDIAGQDGTGQTRLQTWHSIAGFEYGF